VKGAIGVFAVKGGVGKTFIALNIANSLKDKAKVGFIDADFDNSNFSQFTQADIKVEVTEDKKLKLPVWDGIKVFSMSSMVGRDRGVSMSEDRYVRILSDVIEYGDWGDVDYIIIDLPSGSSDIWKGVLTIFGEVLLGDVIVIQPSMTDAAVKALKIHKYFDIPVIGVVENMAYFECEHGGKYHIFGKPVADKLAAEFGYPYIGSIPIIPNLPELIAQGKPFINHEVFNKLADAILSAERPKTSFIERFKEAALAKIKAEVEKVAAYLVVKLQKEFNIGDYARKHGFTEERPFTITITDESGTKILTQIPLQIKNGKLVVLKTPEKVDFDITMSFRTLARVVLGKARRDGDIVPFDPVDAWTYGDIKAYGNGLTPRALYIIKNVITDEELLNNIREKYGKILERWI